MGRPKKKVDPLVASRIKEARENTVVVINGKERKMTQEYLANKLYCSIQSVKNWEQGVTGIDPDHLEDIARICKVDINWLKGLDVYHIVEQSKRILESVDPSDPSTFDRAFDISPKDQATEIAIVYSLLMCGHKESEIVDKERFKTFMKLAIKAGIDFYFLELNDKQLSNNEGA